MPLFVEALPTDLFSDLLRHQSVEWLQSLIVQLTGPRTPVFLQGACARKRGWLICSTCGTHKSNLGIAPKRKA